MHFAPTDEQVALASTVREVLTGGGWRDLAELGLFGALVPESAGGLGLTEVDLVPVFVEIGRSAVALPVAETAAVVVPAVHEAGGDLADLIDGRTIATADLTDSDLLPWGGVSSKALLRAGSELRLVSISGGEAVPTVDVTRAVIVRPSESGTSLSGAPIERAWLRGALATSAQLVGLARRELDLTVAYVKERRQFGVPIGSQQAVKHALANALVELRFTLPVVQRAAVSLADASPDARAHVAAAKAMASRMAEQVARATIQAHGAMGYTVEYELHRYVKRSWALAASWGSAAHHRAVVASSLGLPPATDPSILPWETR